MLSEFSDFFRIDSIFFTVLNYPVSYVEFIGTLAGLISVWLAAKSSIWTWATGLVNVICFFVIFYQVQLYSDMLLQAYFFAMSIYGWIVWGKQDKQEANPITHLSTKRHHSTNTSTITYNTNITKQGVHASGSYYVQCQPIKR